MIVLIVLYRFDWSNSLQPSTRFNAYLRVLPASSKRLARALDPTPGCGSAGPSAQETFLSLFFFLPLPFYARHAEPLESRRRVYSNAMDGREAALQRGGREGKMVGWRGREEGEWVGAEETSNFFSFSFFSFLSYLFITSFVSFSEQR